MPLYLWFLCFVSLFDLSSKQLVSSFLPDLAALSFEKWLSIIDRSCRFRSFEPGLNPVFTFQLFLLVRDCLLFFVTFMSSLFLRHDAVSWNRISWGLLFLFYYPLCFASLSFSLFRCVWLMVSFFPFSLFQLFFSLWQLSLFEWKERVWVQKRVLVIERLPKFFHSTQIQQCFTQISCHRKGEIRGRTVAEANVVMRNDFLVSSYAWNFWTDSLQQKEDMFSKTGTEWKKKQNEKKRRLSRISWNGWSAKQNEIK